MQRPTKGCGCSKRCRAARRRWPRMLILPAQQIRGTPMRPRFLALASTLLCLASFHRFAHQTHAQSETDRASTGVFVYVDKAGVLQIVEASAATVESSPSTGLF